ncbi:MAG: hypothetical protein IPP62_14490 [bacterium]|nr:hypothetical protein [bacterium]
MKKTAMIAAMNNEKMGSFSASSFSPTGCGTHFEMNVMALGRCGMPPP